LSAGGGIAVDANDVMTPKKQINIIIALESGTQMEYNRVVIRVERVQKS